MAPLFKVMHSPILVFFLTLIVHVASRGSSWFPSPSSRFSLLSRFYSLQPLLNASSPIPFKPKSSWFLQTFPKEMPFEEIVALKILLKTNEP